MSELVYEAPMVDREDYEKYGGGHMALYEGKVVGDGSNSVEALVEALRNHPELMPDQIVLFYVQIADVLIL